MQTHVVMCVKPVFSLFLIAPFVLPDIESMSSCSQIPQKKISLVTAIRALHHLSSRSQRVAAARADGVGSRGTTLHAGAWPLAAG